MTEEKYTVSLTEEQVLFINKFVCEESYKLSKQVLVCEEGEQKEDLRKKRDFLMELNDSIMDAILEIMRKYEDEAGEDEG